MLSRICAWRQAGIDNTHFNYSCFFLLTFFVLLKKKIIAADFYRRAVGWFVVQ